MKTYYHKKLSIYPFISSFLLILLIFDNIPNNVKFAITLLAFTMLHIENIINYYMELKQTGKIKPTNDFLTICILLILEYSFVLYMFIFRNP